MDETINEQSSLRSLNKQIKSNLPLKDKKRRNLEGKAIQTEKRNGILIYSWKIVFFLAIGSGLYFLFTSKSWQSIDRGEVYILGSKNIDFDSINRVSMNKFPRPLISINPQKLRTNIKDNLPVKEVSIRREIFPLKLIIQIQERIPIVRAIKQGSNGKEIGFLDIDGYWINKNPDTINLLPLKTLTVKNWNEENRKSISEIIKNRSRFSVPINGILIDHEGNITLETDKVNEIQIGSDISLLGKQIDALIYLIRKLPSEVQKNIKSIDLTDPSKPELQINQE